ncbi:MAG: hypothetical protein ACXAD7_21625 [Candidatus Kariarchaeaceae archaeon]|jgi:hypothetical protein
MDSWEKIFLIIHITILAAILIRLVWQRFKRNIAPLNWIIVVLFLLMLRSVSYLLTLNNYDEFKATSEFHNVFLALMYFTIYLYGELTLDDRPNPFRLAMVGVLLGSFFTVYIKAVFGEVSHPQIIFNKDKTYPVWQIPLDLFVLFVCFFLIYVSFRIYRISYNRFTKISSALLISTFMLFAVSSLLEISEWVIGNDFSQTITALPAFLLLIATFIYNPRFMLSTPMNVKRILILHEDGFPLLDIAMSSASKSELMISNITAYFNFAFPALTSISSSLMEATLSSSTIMYEQTGSIITLLEADKSSYTMRKALHSFVNDFSSYYGPLLDNWRGGKIDTFYEFKAHVGNYFPFAEIKD